MDEQINWKWVFGHTAIIWICSYLLGFIVGYLASPYWSEVSFDTPALVPKAIMWLVAYVNIISVFLVVLIISLVQKITWTHLFLVLIVTTITSFINVTQGFAFSGILFGSFYIGIVMVIAKSLAMFILRTYEVFTKKQ